MDLDALGLNSTFESTELDDKHQPKVDVVETSDIEGPEDFTMNMTYWMTADLPLAQQIRSRKETKLNGNEVRGDARADMSGAQDTTGEGDRVVVEDYSQDESEAGPEPASTTTRVNGTAKSRSSSKAPSEASMENEEKVRSYLSALPDSDLGGNVLTSTPLRIPKQNMLQVPSPSPARARSLQPTVEDYDTPRKPTQETVIHHPLERRAESERESLQQQVAELQSRLTEQENASKTRITELETLLAYTRTDLDTARSESYKHKDQIAKLREDNRRHKEELEESRASVKTQLRKQEQEMKAKMEEFGEELQMQNLARLESEREEFKRQLEEAKLTVDADVASSGEVLAHVKSELGHLRSMHEQEIRELQEEHEQELERLKKGGMQRGDENLSKDVLELHRKLDAIQSRENTLQKDLEKATADAQSAREEALSTRMLHASSEGAMQSHKMRASELQSRVDSLESQLASAEADLRQKDQQLEGTRKLEGLLRSLQKELDDVRDEQIANNQTASQHTQLESRLESLQTQLYSALDNVRAKDQDFLKQIEEQERLEQRLNSAQGRIEGLEATANSLRQQLAEAHRSGAKALTDAEHLEGQLEDAKDRLQDARTEADRRVADVETRLTKLRDLKSESDARLKQLQLSLADLKDDQDTEMEAVRDRAEDAIRKAGSLLQQERTEKRRLATELKRTTQELEQLRAAAAEKAGDDDDDDDDDAEDEQSMLSSTHTDPRDAEMENLRLLIRKQSTSLKTLKSETSSLRRETTRLRALDSSPSNADLHARLDALALENAALRRAAETREQDVAAVNSALDERLAGVLSKTLKERTRSAVGRRDEQWAAKMAGERAFMGKVLMREWGRQEEGVAAEGAKQGYRYKYATRS